MADSASHEQYAPRSVVAKDPTSTGLAQKLGRLAPDRRAGGSFVGHLAGRPPEDRAMVLRALSASCGNRAVTALLRSPTPEAQPAAEHRYEIREKGRPPRSVDHAGALRYIHSRYQRLQGDLSGIVRRYLDQKQIQDEQPFVAAVSAPLILYAALPDPGNEKSLWRVPQRALRVARDLIRADDIEAAVTQLERADEAVSAADAWVARYCGSSIETATHARVAFTIVKVGSAVTVGALAAGPALVAGAAGASAGTLAGELAVNALGVGAYSGAQESARQLGANESDAGAVAAATLHGAVDQATGEAAGQLLGLGFRYARGFLRGRRALTGAADAAAGIVPGTGAVSHEGAAPTPEAHAAVARRDQPGSDRLFDEHAIDAAVSDLEETATPTGKGLRSDERVSVDIDETVAIANQGPWDDPATKRFSERITNATTKGARTEYGPSAPHTTVSLRRAKAAGPEAFREAANALMTHNFAEVEELAAITREARAAMRNLSRPVRQLTNALNRAIRRRIASAASPEARLVHEALEVIGFDPRTISAGPR